MAAPCGAALKEVIYNRHARPLRDRGRACTHSKLYLEHPPSRLPPHTTCSAVRGIPWVFTLCVLIPESMS